MPLTGNPVDDVLIKNFNRLHYGSQDGVYHPNATKVRRVPESMYEYLIRNSSTTNTKSSYAYQ